MKYLKMLGLAAVAAAALMAFVGAGTASANGRLCSTKPEPVTSHCTSPWATGTIIEFSLKSGSSAKLTDTSGNTLDTCTGSTVKGSLVSNATASTATGTITTLGWSGCTVTTDTIENGSLTITAEDDNGNAIVIEHEKTNVTVNVFSSCNYGVEAGTQIGTIHEGIGTSAIFTANATAKKLGGGFLCPETTKWVAEYVLTTPSKTTLWVATG